MDLRADDILLARRHFELRVALSLGAETVALVGPSGAGKTSFLRVIAGLEHPQRGTISLGAEVWLDLARGIDLRPERRRVGYLPQDYALFPHLSVIANVNFAARRDRSDLLERLGVAHLGAARPAALSGGERQRVALARALAREPLLLLLDEPFGALDPLTRGQVRDELADILGRFRLPTLIVTHAFEDAAVLADRVGVIDRGEIIQLDRPDVLERQPESALVAQLTGANILTGTAAPVPGGAIIDLEGGGQLRADTAAAGRVEVALAPWALRLTAPEDARLTGRVLAAHGERGRVVVRLDRLTVHAPAGTTVARGALVGVEAAPTDVRILPPAGRSGRPDPTESRAAQPR